MTLRRSRLIVAAAMLAAATCASCASPSTPSTSPPSSPGADATTAPAPATTASDDCRVDHDIAAPDRDTVTGSIRVLGAASLTGAFGALADAFERAQPRAHVETSFGASSGLVAQLGAGDGADVLATADTTTMNRAVADHSVTAPATFTCNSMAIITAKGNPLHITGLASLARSDVRFVLCAAEVPCGRLGREVLARVGVRARPVGSEADVKAVVAKVGLGEVDAGIAYVTDGRAAGDTLTTIPIPAAQNVTTAYPIAVATHAGNPATARAFIAFVRSTQGRKILDDHGFTG
ncbi:MAG: molybdate ABC transporter substrate-binding protein [Actinobacteria bacterium]|nr:molybdate ABC transporter substrate-binding protein [Actinomycetota bacterium]